MAFFGRTKSAEGGFMDVIRCDQPEYLVWKWRPEVAEAIDETSKDAGHTREGISATTKENAIRYGSMLRVKDGEVAVFVYQQKDGKLQDFIEGPYDGMIKTANFPVLTRIIGVGFGGNSPFQAEVYFINLAGINQIRFGIPYFDIFDPRFMDFAVPVAVRGTLTFKLTDYKTFIKLHRLIDFNVETFKQQVKAGITKYIKSIVANAPSNNDIPVLQLERKILELNIMAENYIKPRMENEFGVSVSSVDIDAIEANKESDGYQRLMAVTGDIAMQTTQAQATVNVRNMQDTQRINAENMQESLRVQREELQRAQKLQTEGSNFAVHQLNQQTEVAKTAAASLGQMGQGAGVSLGDGGGFNPAGMMAGMAMGGAVGQQMAGMMGGMMQGMNQPPSGGVAPPPPPISQYNVAVNGHITGPFTVQQLAQMVVNGQFTSQSMVWKQGMATWASANTVAELTQIFTSLQNGAADIPPPPPAQSGETNNV
jgi:membrane protease subunit (stomatin/prohibitin family)